MIRWFWEIYPSDGYEMKCFRPDTFFKIYPRKKYQIYIFLSIGPRTCMHHPVVGKIFWYVENGLFVSYSLSHPLWNRLQCVRFSKNQKVISTNKNEYTHRSYFEEYTILSVSVIIGFILKVGTKTATVFSEFSNPFK